MSYYETWCRSEIDVYHEKRLSEKRRRRKQRKSGRMSKFNPPTNFQFDKPNAWPEWHDRFSRYRLATKLNKDDGEVQVSALIYAMRNEAEHIYKSMTFATSGTNPEDANDYDTVLRKFEA